MSDKVCEVEVWVVVDENGDWDVAADSDTALENYEGSVGGTSPRRLIKLILAVPLPQALVVRGTVPAPAEPEVALEIEAA